MYINYNIIEKTLFYWKFKNEIGNATDLLAKHSKLGQLLKAGLDRSIIIGRPGQPACGLANQNKQTNKQTNKH